MENLISTATRWELFITWRIIFGLESERLVLWIVRFILLMHYVYMYRSWQQAQRSLWKSGTDVAGEYFKIDSLAFIVVRNSG